MTVYEAPRFYEVLRDLSASGDDRLREVRAGRAIADARTLVRDRDALAEALRDAEAEASRWRSLALKLADMEVQDFLTYAGSMSVDTIIERVHDLSEKFGSNELTRACPDLALAIPARPAPDNSWIKMDSIKDRARPGGTDGAH